MAKREAVETWVRDDSTGEYYFAGYYTVEPGRVLRRRQGFVYVKSPTSGEVFRYNAQDSARALER